MFSIARSVLLYPAILLSLGSAVSLAQEQPQEQPGIDFPVPAAQSQITGAINEQDLVPLPGNVSPMARPEYDQGRVADSLPQTHILMMLKRSAAQADALDQFMQEQYQPHSSNFHNWLTPEQYGQLFGPTAQDVGQVTQWLTKHGFTVNNVASGRTFIDFSGTAGQIASAFHTEIHRYEVDGEQHYANAGEPMIPAALAPVVSGFRALNNFHPKALPHPPGVAHLDRSTGKWSRSAASGNLTDGTGTSATYLVGPQDFAEIYGVNQVWGQAISTSSGSENLVGTGQTIGIAGDTDLASADIQSFRDQFGISALGPNGSVIVDNPPASVCTAPPPSDVDSANDPEGYLDAEWSGAMAPDATIDFVTCDNSGVTAGADLAAAYIVQDPAHAEKIGVLSTSYGYCEQDPISESNQFYVSLWQQAAAEGMTVVVAAGDSGSAYCDQFTSNYYAVQGLAVNAEASTPYNVAVGGTDFSDVFSGATATYWSGTNGANLESALSYIPETTWNDSCANPLILTAFGSGYTTGAGPDGFCTYASQLPIDPMTGSIPYFNDFAASGGLSTVSSRPVWQTGVPGIPGGTARALPDISMFAGIGITWGHALLFCDSGILPSGITCDFSNANNLYDNEDGGTSFDAPSFAGIVALINQKNGGREGQVNNILYPLAQDQYVSTASSTQPSLASCASYLGNQVLSSCYFHDITGTPNPNPATQAATPFFFGSISVPCTGSATAAGVFTDTSTNPASNWEDCYGYQITVTGSGSNLTATPNYYGIISSADSAGSAAYSAGPGYDLATGLGSPNVAALVNAPQWSTLAITTTTLPAAEVGVAYSQTLTATGKLPPYSWSVASGSLPAGLSLAAATGVLSGTPNAAGTSMFVIQVADSEGTPMTATASFSLTVEGPPQPPGFTAGVSPSSLALPFAGSGAVTITITGEGGFTGPVNFACGKLPQYFTCSFAAGSLSLPAQGGSLTNQLTISTAQSSPAVQPSARGFVATLLWLPLSAGLLIRRRGKGRKRFPRALWMLAFACLSLGAIVVLNGCGQSSQQSPAGSYSIPIDLTSSEGASQTLSVTVNVDLP